MTELWAHVASCAKVPPGVFARRGERADALLVRRVSARVNAPVNTRF